MEKRTPLYDAHVALGAKMVPYAGYSMPVQYSGVMDEIKAVRNTAGLFDVSHMGELYIKGPDALKNLNAILTNDFTDMVDGQCRYTIMCYENGTTVDDLIVYKVNNDEYYLIVNASNKDKDYAWMKDIVAGDVEFKDLSDDYGQVALQGPKAMEIFAKVTDAANLDIAYYNFKFGTVAGVENCIISRTGYTGEDGVEVYVPAAQTAKVWDAIMEAGKEFGLLPAGLGSRDTLRLEAGMPLYGHEMSDSIMPVETGLGFAVKLKKESDFVGKAAMVAAKEAGLKRKRIGFKAVGRGIARGDEEVMKDGKVIGYVTSGTHSPTLGYPIGMALVDTDAGVALGDKLTVTVRKKPVEVEVIKSQFLKN